MKVLDLRCSNGHGFEGWFGSEDEFLDQNGRGLLQCPMCADHVVTRMPSAPRLNLGASEAVASARAPEPTASAPLPVAQVQAAWLKAVQHVLAHTEDVGERFAGEARRIHYGEAPQRGIRGQANEEQRQALLEEGIEVMTLPLPAGMDGPVH